MQSICSALRSLLFEYFSLLASQRFSVSHDQHHKPPLPLGAGEFAQKTLERFSVFSVVQAGTEVVSVPRWGTGSLRFEFIAGPSGRDSARGLTAGVFDAGACAQLVWEVQPPNSQPHNGRKANERHQPDKPPRSQQRYENLNTIHQLSVAARAGYFTPRPVWRFGSQRRQRSHCKRHVRSSHH
jgi:hypothetical protein